MIRQQAHRERAKFPTVGIRNEFEWWPARGSRLSAHGDARGCHARLLRRAAEQALVGRPLDASPKGPARAVCENLRLLAGYWL